MYLLGFYVVLLVYVQSFVTYVVMYLFIKTLQLHHQRDLRLQHTILNKEIIHNLSQGSDQSNLEIIKWAQRRSWLKWLQRLYVKLL